MKLYQVTRRRALREHDGYSYYASKTVAEKEQRKENDNETNQDDVREIEFTPNKKGIIALLNEIASYPDNG
jgi:ribosomal protein L2